MKVQIPMETRRCGCSTHVHTCALPRQLECTRSNQKSDSTQVQMASTKNSKYHCNNETVHVHRNTATMINTKATDCKWPSICILNTQYKSGSETIKYAQVSAYIYEVTKVAVNNKEMLTMVPD
jgi:hypothetical protein